MVNEGILGGLKLALSKGESLKQAMMSFYNAGYKKEDIEAAARALHEQRSEQVQQEQPVEQPETIKSKPQKIIQRISSYGEEFVKKNKTQVAKPVQAKEKILVKNKPIQKISQYEQKPNEPKLKLAIIILMLFLFILLGLLASVFIFRQEMLEFFNNMI